MKVFADKLGYEQKKFMNFNKLLFPWKPLYLKILVLVTAIDVLNCILVSKSAQFA